MNRRGFLGGLAAFAAACTLDPELSLWKPGAKTISIPQTVVSEPGISIRYIKEWDRIDFYWNANEPTLKIWPPLSPADPRSEIIANQIEKMVTSGWAPMYPEYSGVVMG